MLRAMDASLIMPTMASAMSAYIPVLLILVMGIMFVIGNLAVTKVLGPSRHGPVKDMTYESGMNPIGTARKRFNVRFYLIAMVFLVFDIEVIFLYPWAASFPNIAPYPNQEGLIWLFRIFFFLATTVVAYIYGYRKGVFKFD